MYKKIIFFILLLCVLAPRVEARIHILIDEASQKKFPIAVPAFLDSRGNETSMGTKFAELLRKDLQIAGIFKVIDDSQLPHKDSDTDTINFKKWQAIEAGALVKGFVEKIEGSYVYKIKLYDVDDGQMIMGKKFVVPEKKLYIDAVHRFVDSLMESLTGTRGPFHSMIAASCGGNFKKTIGTFNMDNTKRGGISKGGANMVSPSFSPGGGEIAYVAYTPQGFPEVYINGRPITNLRSTTITPAWLTGNKLIVASAFRGDTELYLINNHGKVLQQITNSRNIDFNPSVTGGGQIVFSSERAGGLHLFSTSTGGGASQLTYTGYQNDQPDWSPDGTKIVFTGRDKHGAFDIFVMEADGSNIMRLTRGQGSNEAPSWAPDSRYIAYSATRGGIYIMLDDGSNETLIEKTGACNNLDWGPWLSKQ